MSPRARTDTCTGCGATLEDDTRRYNKCPECVRAYYREWSKTPKARAKAKRAQHRYGLTEHGQRRRRSANLMADYGIDIDEFERMLAVQKNKCAICSQTFSEGALKACVDHCHKTGRVRGILCRHCNVGIGLFHDDTIALANAIKYLKGRGFDSRYPAEAGGSRVVVTRGEGSFGSLHGSRTTA